MMQNVNTWLSAIVLVLVIIICTSLLILYRRSRNSQTSTLPLHKGDLESKTGRPASIASSTSSTKSFVEREKEEFLASTYGPPTSPPPAIHLTLPEELDDGTKTDARIVVVNVGEHGEVGLSPLEQEQLPPYQEHAEERFQSLDLERLGGLREHEQK